jgi:hypothetical protein
MNRFIAYAALAGFVCVSVASATEIETFDNPNGLQDPAKNGGNVNYVLNRDGGTWTTGNGVTQTFGATFYELGTHPTASSGSYGTGYHNINTQNLASVVDISGNSRLQLDVTINGGTDAGLFVDLLDGEGDFYKYFYGFGRTGNAAADSAAGLQPGETITQGGPNQEIMQVPLATPFADINGTGTFDFTQVVLYRLENDPGFSGSTPNPSDVSFNDLSGVSVPEPTGLAALAGGALLIGRRRRR